MRDFRDSKTMAQSLRRALSDQSVTISHSESLELIAKAFGLDNWNILAAKIEAERPEVTRPEPAVATGGKVGVLYCSFCGKSQHEVKKLIAGPSVFICNECIGLCDGIMLEGDIQDRLRDALLKAPDANPLDAARAAFSSYSDEQLKLCAKSYADNLEHLDWSIRLTAEALAREPMQWIPDDLAKKRGWTSDPLSGKSREEIVPMMAVLTRRAAEAHRAADLIAGVLRARGIEAPFS
jgi:hypothetical protein